MDDYGCARLTKEDAKEIWTALDRTGSVVFPLTAGDSIGCMIVIITRIFEKVGVMPFGGNPTGRMYVGIYGRGCNHFSMDSIHAGYFEEKLQISREEAETFSKFWEMMWHER